MSRSIGTFLGAYPVLRVGTTWVVVAAIFSLYPIFAKDPADAEARSKSKDAEVRKSADYEPGAIPECIKKLKLSSDQEKKIQEVVQSYDGSIALVWKQFGEKYMHTIAIETSMLAAIEDSFTEDQLRQVRDSRRKLAQFENPAEKTATDKSEKPSSPASSKNADVIKDELTSTGVTLTTEQQETAEAIQLKYRSHLRGLNQRLQELHTRLISLEAEKLVAIEKILTKDQLAELRKNRQQAPNTPGVAQNSPQSKKSD
jgi:hypothetical protein